MARTVPETPEASRHATAAIGAAPPLPAPDATGPPVIMLGASQARVTAALGHLGAQQRPVVVLTGGAPVPPDLPTDDARVRVTTTPDPIAACLDAFDGDPAFTFLGATFVAGAAEFDDQLPSLTDRASAHLQAQLNAMDARRAAWQRERAARRGAIRRLFGVVDDSTTALQYIMDDMMRAATRCGMVPTCHVESYRTDPFRAIRRFDAITRSAPDAVLCLAQTGAMALGPLATGVPAICYYSSDPERRPVPPNALAPHDHLFVADSAWRATFTDRGATAHHLPLATSFGDVLVDPADPAWQCDALLVAHLTDARDVLPGVDDAAFDVIDALAARLAFERSAPSSDDLVRHSPLAEHENAARRIARAIEVQATWHRRRRAAIDIADAGIDLRIHGDERWRRALDGTSAAPAYRGALDYRRDMPHAFAGAAVVVNVGSLNAPTALNMRAFDVPAVGGCLLTDARPGVDESFVVGAEVATYDHPDALVPALRALLDDDDHRATLGAGGRRRVAADHSWDARWHVIMRRLGAAAAVMCAVLLTLALPDHAHAGPPVAGDVTALLDGHAASGTRAIIHLETSDGTTIDRALGALDPAHRYESAALSRTLTGAAILRLVADQQLALDDTVAAALAPRQLRLREPVARLTVRDLLTHRSGLPLHTEWRGVDLHDGDAALQRLVALEPDFPAGGRPRATVLDDILLAGIIEAASGIPYERYVRSALLRPAGLETMITFRTDLDWSRRGTAGALATPAAFARWFHAVFTGTLLPETVRDDVLRAEFASWVGGWSLFNRGATHVVRAEAPDQRDAMLLVHEHDRSTDAWTTLVVASPDLAGGRRLAHAVIHADPPPLRTQRADATALDALPGTWADADGCPALLIRRATDGAALDVWPLTQTMIHALAPIGQQVRNLDVVNARSRHVVEALLADRADRVRDALAPEHDDDWTFHMIRRIEAHVGALGSADGTTLIGSWTDAGGTTRTTFYATGPRGARPITVVWRHGLVVDIDLDAPAPTIARFVPRRDGTIAAIDLATRHVTELEIVRRADGGIDRVRLGAHALTWFPRDARDDTVAERLVAEPTSGE